MEEKEPFGKKGSEQTIEESFLYNGAGYDYEYEYKGNDQVPTLSDTLERIFEQPSTRKYILQWTSYTQASCGRYLLEYSAVSLHYVVLHHTALQYTMALIV